MSDENDQSGNDVTGETALPNTIDVPAMPMPAIINNTRRPALSIIRMDTPVIKTCTPLNRSDAAVALLNLASLKI